MSGGIVQVAIGLGDVGGTAHLGRLVARTLAAYAAEKALPFEVLDLGRADPRLAGIARTGFHGDRLALARAVAARQLARRRPRLLFFDHLGPSRIQTLLPSLFRAPYVVFIHGIEVWKPLDSQRRRALAGAVRVLTNSETTARQAAPYLPERVKPLPVHLALEPAADAGEADSALLAHAGAGFVLTVGRLGSDRKGYDELLAALPALRALAPDARLVVAGGGSDQPRLAALARDLGVAGAVLFTGQLSAATLAALYERAAVFTLPSLVEGFGLVFVEAMRAGKPCVALAGTAPAEIVVDGETGLHAADAEPATLASALAWLLANPDEAARLGEAGRARYLAEFTAEAFAARLWPHLDALLA